MGPELTKKQKLKLQAEIRAFNQKKTLSELEKNVSKPDVNAYQDWLDSNGNHEPLAASMDSLSDETMQTPDGKPNLEIMSGQFEVDEILSHRQSQVWNLCMRRGLSAEEASLQLNLKRSTVEQYLANARAKVKDHFNV